MKKSKYTQEQIDFIVEKYRKSLAREVQTEFERIFGFQIPEGTIRTLASKNGNYQKDKCKYTQEQIEFVKELYNEFNAEESAKKFNEKYNTNLNSSNFRSLANYYGVKCPREYGFKPGKKLSPEIYEKCKKTMFKKGHKTYNVKPIGSERFDRGYVYIKIDDKKWITKQKHIYQQHYGPIPDGYQVIFADGNSLNCDIDNLILVSKREMRYINSNHLYIRNNEKIKFNESIVKLTKLNLKIYDKEKKDAS